MDIDVGTRPPVLDRPGLLVRPTPDGPLTLVTPRRTDRLLARLLAGWLDARLAGGAAAEDDLLLAVRAERLTSPRHRAALATAWLDVLDRARGARTLLDTRAPVARTTVVAAATPIARLVDVLRSPAPAHAGDVARTSLLLTDGRSAVYTGGDLAVQVAALADRLGHDAPNR